MGNILDIIAIPLEYVLKFLNLAFNNYSAAIIGFTVIVQLALLPLSIKQQVTMAKQAKLRPKLERIKEKCGDDRMKFQQAQQDLYQRENVGMMGGCLPMAVRMIIIIGVYQAVRNLVAEGSANFMLFGLDLAQTPKFSTDIVNNAQWIWIIPFLSFATSFISMLLSQLQQRRTNPQQAQAGNSMLIMMLMMPFVSLYFTFTVPGAVGFYWICSNVVNSVIMLGVNEAYSADKIIAKDMAKAGKKRREDEKIIIAKNS